MKRSWPSGSGQDYAKRSPANGIDLSISTTPIRNDVASTSRDLNGNSSNVTNGLTTQDLNMTLKTQQRTQNHSSTFGNSPSERIHFFTGTAERVLAWSRVVKQHCYFEVIASVISIQESPDKSHDTLLFRDKKGPILQVIRYSNHEMLEQEFNIGQILRCVGYMTGINTMTAVNIRRATSEEIASLSRLCYIGGFTVSGLIAPEENLL